MILILSDEDEPTTDLVIEWLVKYKKPFIRFSCKSSVVIKKIYFDKLSLEAQFTICNNIGFFDIDSKEISSFWYRRSGLQLTMPELNISDDEIKEAIYTDLKIEYLDCRQILSHILAKKTKLNKESDPNICKIIVLEKAKAAGLSIPDSIVCTSKEELLPFCKKHNAKVVTKSIGDPSYLFMNGISSYTSKINIKSLPSKFALSLFQEMINKHIELRIFYFEGYFFSSAIFSQLDKQTKVDFKKYNSKKPNRVVPYRLPIEIENKLQIVMDVLGLKSGSIDMVLTESNDYVFLEVNPVGQFEQVSIPCNYDIPKKIAEYL